MFRMLRIFFAALVVAAAAAPLPAASQLAVIPRLVVGCEPLQVDSFTIQVRSCTAANATGDAYISFTTTNMHIGNNGAWGVDRSFTGSVPGWWYLWGIGNATGTLNAMMLSPSWIGGGVILPTGYTRLRYMGAAFYINGSSSGMRKQMIQSWLSPTSFIYQDQSTLHEIDVEPTDGAWVRINLFPLVPQEARIAYVSITAEAAPGSGSVQVRTPSSGDGGFPIAVGEQTTRDIALSSDTQIEVRTGVGVRAVIRVLGFEIMSVY